MPELMQQQAAEEGRDGDGGRDAAEAQHDDAVGDGVDAYAEGRASFDELALDPTFRDFVCLYIAEGYKSNRNTVSICNSDPTVVVLCDQWIRRLSTRTPDYSVQYHADQDLDELRQFWGEQFGVHPELVRMQRKSNSSQLTSRT